MAREHRSTASVRQARGRVLPGAVALLLLAAACGDSTDEVATSSSTTATTSTAGGDDVGEYCEKSLEIETVGEPDIDFETATPEEQAEAVKKFATEVYVPLAEEIQDNAPDEIAEDIDVLVAAVQELGATGDFETVFGAPEVEAAEEQVHDFDLATCGWGRADVTAVEYEFQGIDATYEAGPVSFELRNDGGEFHELVLLKKNEGVSESFADILSGSEEEGMAKVTSVGGTFAEPGDDAYAVADLEPGEYVAVCFVPVGSTPEAVEEAEASGEEPEAGPPHSTQGMSAEFTVA